MRRLFPRPTPAAESAREEALAPPEPLVEAAAAILESPAEPDPPAKPFPELPLCFMLSHVEPDGPVRLDGVKVALTELMGLELDAPKLGAFAGLLNACDFPLQLLVAKHPPDLERMRREMEEAQPGDLPDQTREAAQSQRRLLTELESRRGHSRPALLRRLRGGARAGTARPAGAFRSLDSPLGGRTTPAPRDRRGAGRFARKKRPR